jgi:hypothetical protein
MLFVFVIIIIAMVIVDGKPGHIMKLDRKWKALKQSCEKNECGSLIPEESANCVNRCTSPLCFDEVYKTSPLEDGEIDDNRSRLFTSCLRKEQKDLLKSSKNSVESESW